MFPWPSHSVRVPQSAMGQPPITREMRRGVCPAATGRPCAVMPESTTPTTMPVPRTPAAQICETPR